MIFLKSKSIQTTITTAFLTALQLLIGIQIARSLGAFNRGELSLLTAWAPVFAVLFSGGITDALSYHMGQNKDPSQRLRFVTSAQLLLFLLSIIGLFVAIAFTFLVVNERLPRYSGLAISFLVIIPLVNIANMNLALDLSRDKIGYYNITRIIQTLTYCVLVLVSLHELEDPIPGIVVATLIQSAMPILFNLRSFAGWREFPRLETIRELWRNSYLFWPGICLSFLATQADRLVGTLMLKFDDLGIFHVSQSLSFTAISVLSFTPYLLILPTASQIENSDSRQKYVVAQLSLWNLVILLFMFMFVPFSYFTAPLILGPQYQSTGLAMAILAPGHAALVSRMMAARSLRSVGHSSVAPISEAIFLLLIGAISVMFSSLSHLDWFNLAIIASASSCLSSVVFFTLLSKRLGVPIAQFIDFHANWLRLVRIVAEILRSVKANAK